MIYGDAVKSATLTAAVATPNSYSLEGPEYKTMDAQIGRAMLVHDDSNRA